MEPGLAFTLCGLGICFLIPAFILGFINRSKTTRCTVTTVATVKDILAKNSGDSLSSIHYTSTKLTLSYIRILVHIYHIMSHRRGQNRDDDIIQTIQRSRIFRATIPKYISY